MIFFDGEGVLFNDARPPFIINLNSTNIYQLERSKKICH